MVLRTASRNISTFFCHVNGNSHSEKGKVVSQWMVKHMQADAGPRSEADEAFGPKAPRAYRITAEGRKVLKVVQKQLHELGVEVDHR